MRAQARQDWAKNSWMDKAFAMAKYTELSKSDYLQGMSHANAKPIPSSTESCAAPEVRAGQARRDGRLPHPPDRRADPLRRHQRSELLRPVLLQPVDTTVGPFRVEVIE